MALYDLNWPFIAHIVVETPACLTFMFNPSGQLGQHTPNAHAIVRQYSLLLLSSILVASIFVSRARDELTGQVAGALAIYHVGPCIRAMSRSRGFSLDPNVSTTFEAPLFLLVHSVCLASLLHCCWTSYITIVCLGP